MQRRFELPFVHECHEVTADIADTERGIALGGGRSAGRPAMTSGRLTLRGGTRPCDLVPQIRPTVDDASNALADEPRCPDAGRAGRVNARPQPDECRDCLRFVLTR